MAGKAGGEIIDISDTPDVAVWANSAKKIPRAVKEPSKVSSISLHVKGSEEVVDPADKKQVAKVEGHILTDESNYGKEE